MARTFRADDGSVFRTEILMKTRNRQLRELEDARAAEKAARDSLTEAFEKELTAWCSQYIVYTSESRENIYRINVPGTEVSVFWIPGLKRIASLDWEGAHECTPWQKKRLLDNRKEIRKILAGEQNRRMKTDAEALDRRIAALKKETEEITL